MWSLSIVVRNILANSHPQMSFTKKHEPTQGLALDAENEAFREGVQIRAPRGQSHWLHACIVEIGPNISGEDRISVHDEMRLA